MRRLWSWHCHVWELKPWKASRLLYPNEIIFCDDNHVIACVLRYFARCRPDPPSPLIPSRPENIPYNFVPEVGLIELMSDATDLTGISWGSSARSCWTSGGWTTSATSPGLMLVVFGKFRVCTETYIMVLEMKEIPIMKTQDGTRAKTQIT